MESALHSVWLRDARVLRSELEMERGVSERQFFFGTNLKMHQTASDTAAFLDGLFGAIGSSDARVQFFVIPPFTSLATVAHHPARSVFWIGAQNMHWALAGAFTGEISAPMLQEFDVDLVLIGHAERRQLFGETDETVWRKVRTTLQQGMRALLCVGETASERDAGIGSRRVLEQLERAVAGLSTTEAHDLLIAYEPVWSIGEKGTPADPIEIRPVFEIMRRWLGDRFGREVRPPLLYGGSVDLNNCAAFATAPEIDGLFVGRAAWTVSGFTETAWRSSAARFASRSS